MDEGIKKIGIIDRLLSNRYLQSGSIVFIDEPESFLHPKAIIEFIESGMNFIIDKNTYIMEDDSFYKKMSSRFATKDVDFIIFFLFQ